MEKPITGNALLDGLSAADRERLLPELDAVMLAHGQVVHEAQQPIEIVYFPQQAVCSSIALLEDGATTEVAMIGREGLVGTAVLLGDRRSHHDCIAQSPGPALAVSTDVLLRQAETSHTLRNRLLRFIQALTFHTAQSAACAAHHVVHKRCARWLLAAADRRNSHDLRITHEFLAMMLGVRRAGVSEATKALQRAGLIHTEPGRITILDREGLEAAACECYGRIRDEYLRLLEEPATRPGAPTPSAARLASNGD